MPPIVALLLTVVFVGYLFRRDFEEQPNVTRALWIPIAWMLIIGSRFVSMWLDTFGVPVGGISLEEGSPIDAAVFLILIVSAARILVRRQVRLSEIVRENQWLAIFFVYCFIAISWSDFPFVAFKRWIKIIGHPLMVLILFTEPDPEEAVARLMKRCAYILIPVSVLFIKYYPEFGRSYDVWSGMPSSCGITTNKNELGYVCLVLGLFFGWNLLKTLREETGKRRRNELVLTIGFLSMIWWLLYMARSATSLISLVVGMLTLIFLGLPFVNKRRVGTYALIAVSLMLMSELLFGVSAQALKVLGRDSTLTDRTEVWHDVLQIHINPILGAGFESFWLGERREKMWAKWNWEPNQAHNGYLETYLNLGFVGLIILIALLLATFWRCRRELLVNFEFGRYRLGFLAATIVYNCTEASFKALSLMWFVFHIIAMEYSGTRCVKEERPLKKESSGQEAGLDFAELPRA
jgi:exopolysaccharide production protein ExoQ